MAKYAVTIGSSHAYAMGLNATLNALDYYGVKDIDVYVFSNKFMKDYFDYAKDKFNFSLHCIDTEELCPAQETTFADDGGSAWQDVMFFWGKYPLMMQLKDKYDAILHLDGDMMVTDDISQYFDIAAATGKLLIAENGRRSYRLEQISEPRFNVDKDALLEFCKGFPVLNYVFFLDVKKYVRLFEYVWDLRNNAAKNTKHFGLETAYFVQGLYELGLLDQVMPLDFGHWVADDYLGKAKVNFQADSNGRYHLVAPDCKYIQVFHGRFWNCHITEHTIELTGENQIKNVIYNFESYTRLTDFLNHDWKVKLGEIVKLNPHYENFLNPNKVWPIVSQWLKEKGAI